MKDVTQYSRIARLLTRRRGCTSMDIISAVGTVSPHSRISEMKRAGWDVRKVKVPGRSFHRYYGTAPKA